MSVHRLIVKPKLTDIETKALEGKFIELDSYDEVIDYDCDCYYIDSEGNQKALFYYRRNVIPPQYLENALSAFKREAAKASNKRKIASGHTGKGKVKSLIAGHFDKPRIRDKHDINSKGLVPCRTTSFTQKHREQWSTLIPLIESVDRAYQQFEPERHQEQLDLARQTSEFQIEDTAFSTITVNYNWRTACHQDAGDYHNGYSVILVAEDGKDSYDGGYLGYPKFGVAVDVRHGDFILKDPHQWHCNTELEPTGSNWCRLSMVFYYRENMQKCAQQRPPTTIQKRTMKLTPDTTQKRKIAKPRLTKKAVAQQGGAGAPGLELVKAVYPKRGLDLELYIRPKTTDAKVIDEVLKTNSYDKPKIKFKVCDQPGERWLDLGGNIGTFALLVLSRGGSVVSYEPEQENHGILQQNLEHNFPKGRWKVVKAGVSAKPSGSQQLYLCKTDYNKYRHTLHPIRGRQTVDIKVDNIQTVLQREQCDCIKMDIEGAEIEILEAIKANDYQKAGIKKLVFEYSFDVDRSIPRFLAIVKGLQGYFKTVFYTKVNPAEKEYNHYPPACLVYCLR